MRTLAVLVAAWGLCANPLLAQDHAAPPTTPCLNCVCDVPCEPAESAGCFYSEVTYLQRWFKPVCASVPIVSVGNPQDAVPGAVGQPGTRLAVGGDPPHKFEFGGTPGIELKTGWVSADGNLGVEVSGFLMDIASDTQSFRAAPNGAPFSYLPYQAPDNSQQALPFTVPGVVTGRSLIISSTHLWGAEGNVVLPFTVEHGSWSVAGKFLVGGRYLDLTDRDRLFNTLQLVADPTGIASGADQFITRNQFAGPQVGTVMGVHWGCVSLDLTTKLAAGITHQVRIIEGSPLAYSSPTAGQLLPGPFTALPSNVGRETANRVTLVPEIGLKTRVDLGWCSLSLGYTLLYWNKVLCPGDQMSPLVNITQLPFHGPFAGSRDPAPLFNHTDYFAQGFDCGIEFHF